MNVGQMWVEIFIKEIFDYINYILLLYRVEIENKLLNNNAFFRHPQSITTTLEVKERPLTFFFLNQ